jgi:hypothetical protein
MRIQETKIMRIRNTGPDKAQKLRKPPPPHPLSFWSSICIKEDVIAPGVKDSKTLISAMGEKGLDHVVSIFFFLTELKTNQIAAVVFFPVPCVLPNIGKG